MSDCAACGTRLEEGITKCPQCGADLKLPGAFMHVLGWVVFFAASIPIVVGIETLRQRNYVPLGIGVATVVAGVVLIVLGRSKARSAPATTKPSAPPSANPAK
jgi:hypothetical protein